MFKKIKDLLKPKKEIKAVDFKENDQEVNLSSFTTEDQESFNKTLDKYRKNIEGLAEIIDELFDIYANVNTKFSKNDIKTLWNIINYIKSNPTEITQFDEIFKGVQMYGRLIVSDYTNVFSMSADFYDDHVDKKTGKMIKRDITSGDVVTHGDDLHKLIEKTTDEAWKEYLM